MKPTISEQVTFFEDKGIRRVYDEQTDTWYFSVVDIVGALTEQPDTAGARNYWKVLKSRLKKEGSEVVTSCNRLKLTAQDGKRYLTDVAAADVILRIIQSVPSPKAEPIKLWLAQVGYERMQEMADPAIAIDRARALYKQHGRSDKWIEQRMMAYYRTAEKPIPRHVWLACLGWEVMGGKKGNGAPLPLRLPISGNGTGYRATV